MNCMYVWSFAHPSMWDPTDRNITDPSMWKDMNFWIFRGNCNDLHRCMRACIGAWDQICKHTDLQQLHTWLVTSIAPPAHNCEIADRIQTWSSHNHACSGMSETKWHPVAETLLSQYNDCWYFRHRATLAFSHLDAWCLKSYRSRWIFTSISRQVMPFDIAMQLYIGAQLKSKLARQREE